MAARWFKPKIFKKDPESVVLWNILKSWRLLYSNGFHPSKPGSSDQQSYAYLFDYFNRAATDTALTEDMRMIGRAWKTTIALWYEHLRSLNALWEQCPEKTLKIPSLHLVISCLENYTEVLFHQTHQAKPNALPVPKEALPHMRYQGGYKPRPFPEFFEAVKTEPMGLGVESIENFMIKWAGCIGQHAERLQPPARARVYAGGIAMVLVGGVWGAVLGSMVGISTAVAGPILLGGIVIGGMAAFGYYRWYTARMQKRRQKLEDWADKVATHMGAGLMACFEKPLQDYIKTRRIPVSIMKVADTPSVTSDTWLRQLITVLHGASDRSSMAAAIRLPLLIHIGRFVKKWPIPTYPPPGEWQVFLAQLAALLARLRAVPYPFAQAYAAQLENWEQEVLAWEHVYAQKTGAALGLEIPAEIPLEGTTYVPEGLYRSDTAPEGAYSQSCASTPKTVRSLDEKSERAGKLLLDIARKPQLSNTMIAPVVETETISAPPSPSRTMTTTTVFESDTGSSSSSSSDKAKPEGSSSTVNLSALRIPPEGEGLDPRELSPISPSTVDTSTMGSSGNGDSSDSDTHSPPLSPRGTSPMGMDPAIPLPDPWKPQGKLEKPATMCPLADRYRFDKPAEGPAKNPAEEPGAPKNSSASPTA